MMRCESLTYSGKQCSRRAHYRTTRGVSRDPYSGVYLRREAWVCKVHDRQPALALIDKEKE